MNRRSWLSLGLVLATALHSAAADGPAWSKVNTGQTGGRQGSVLLHVPELKRMLLVGLAKDAPFVQAFDPQQGVWEEFSADEPMPSDFNNPNKQPGFSFQAAYDSGSRTIYCLSSGNVLYAFDTVAKSWKTSSPEPELSNLAWPTLACDTLGRRLVVVGAEKKGNELGWSRTVVCELATGVWKRLEVTDAEVLAQHRELVAGKESLIDLAGAVRSAWYRDPAGVGSEAERDSLLAQLKAIAARAGLAKHSAELAVIREAIRERDLLAALRQTRALQRVVEESAEAQFPVPCARRNSPLAFDPATQRFVLFGGDHQDYVLNDTWTLDLARGRWQRMTPERAPSPRAGHALISLPGGRLALYEGYTQATSTDYGAMPWSMISPVQLWLYDVAANRWDLAGAWTPPEKKDDGESFAPVAYFYGGEANNRFAGPALAADDAGRLVLAGTDTLKTHWQRWKRPATTWTLELDPANVDAAETARVGAAPNQRLYRPSLFRAEFCESEKSPTDPQLAQLPANQWVRLPAAPCNPAAGCRGRDWSTSVWDSDRDQILLWGGGHCVRSSSTVLHYSPTAGRIVEGFDADESYGSNSPADGTLAHDSSILGRPWVAVHNYKHYAYDPKCKLLVSARGYVYDPTRMDWLRQEKLELPFHFGWGSTAVASTPHGTVAWSRKLKGEDAGLWIFDRERGWVDLEPQGKLVVPWCDTHGMVYDSARDRLIFSGMGGGYGKSSDGTLLTFQFADKSLRTLTPENLELGRTPGCLRELAYAAHADWLLLGCHLRVGDEKKGKAYTRVYDCKSNRYFLLDAGPAPDSHESGWMYDAKRQVVYSFSTHAAAWALRIDPKTATRLEGPQSEPAK